MTDRQMLQEIAKQLRLWAHESREYGWSTHQVDPMRDLASDIEDRLALYPNQADERELDLAARIQALEDTVAGIQEDLASLPEETRQMSVVCADCNSVMTNDTLSQWNHGCLARKKECDAGWHHIPCQLKPQHGAGLVTP